jgi:predicted O-methyltransferase YrrM
MTPGGPVAALIDEGMAGFGPFRRFMAEELTRLAYSEEVIASREELVASTGLTRNEVSLSVRLPLDIDGFTFAAYGATAAAMGLLPLSKNVGERLGWARDAIAGYDHGVRKTYIFPEEGALAYLIAAASGAKSMISLGSYYGYWSAWAALGLTRGAKLTLVDSDPAVCAAAEANFDRLDVEADVGVVCAEATAFLRGSSERYDFALLDAEGPLNPEDPRMRRKAVYGPIVEAFLPVAAPGALLLAHNILLGHPFPDPYFDCLVTVNKEELLEFHQRLANATLAEITVSTVEGTGVYRLR